MTLDRPDQGALAALLMQPSAGKCFKALSPVTRPKVPSVFAAMCWNLYIDAVFIG